MTGLRCGNQSVQQYNKGKNNQLKITKPLLQLALKRNLILLEVPSQNNLDAFTYLERA